MGNKGKTEMEMVKESARKCSHCGNNGHNSRTCSGGGRCCLKLFGVEILTDKEEEAMKKSFSMGNLQSCNVEHHGDHGDAGYLSDGLIQSRRCKRAHERKKGVPWTEEEHRTFLAGLEKLGKGDWRGIAKKFVVTRTPTQVASHAQKYFLRQAACDKRKRRPSLFDMPLDPAAPAPKASVSLHKNTESFHLPKANLSTRVMNPISSLRMEGRPQILPVAATPVVPDICGVPYMVGVPVNMSGLPETKVIEGVSYVPMASFSRPSFVCLQANTSLGMSHSMGEASSESPTTQKDGLELSIRPPENQKGGADLSSQTSGSIIRVI